MTPSEQAEAAWALAPLLAARRSVRYWNGPDRKFDRAQILGRALPQRPAAIPIFDKRGRATVLVLDFDPQDHGREQVVRDSELAALWIREAGGRVIVDESSRGGRHVLMPLPHGIDVAVRHLRPLLDELARRLPTLDIVPMANPDTGCITAPGSPCKEGGFRTLLTPLPEAFAALAERSNPGTLARFAARLGISSLRAAAAANQGGAPDPGDEDTAVNAGTGGHSGVRLPAAILEFAVHGVVPDRLNQRGERWTRHEARQSVLAHAAVRGASLATVRTKLAAGDWAGLRSAYDRYGAIWERHLRKDWKKALTWAQQVAPKFRVSAHEEVHTGGQVSLRTWLARAERWTMQCAVLEGQTRWTALAMWQALAYAAQITGGPTVAQGRRWLSIAAGLLSEETVSAFLRTVRDLPGAPILLVEQGAGASADRYALVTPRINGEEVAADPELVARTRVEPVHPAWAVAGLAARRVFDALEHTHQSGADLVRPRALPALTGMSSTQVYAALSQLAGHGLVERGHGWARRTDRDLTDIAVDHAVDELRAEHVARHRRERRQWRDLLALWEGEVAAEDCPAAEQLAPADPWTREEREAYVVDVMATGPPPHDLPDAPDNPDSSAVKLVVDILGARLLEVCPTLEGAGR